MINEAKLVLLLLSLGSQTGINHNQALNELESLVEKSVPKTEYLMSSQNCNVAPEVIDYMITSEDKVIVDYNTISDSSVESCQAQEQFCRAIFNKKEELERINCR